MMMLLQLKENFLSFCFFVRLARGGGGFVRPDLLDPVSCFVGRLSILGGGTADVEPAAATAAFDNRPDADAGGVVVVGRRDVYDAQDRLGARVGAAVGVLGGAFVAQPFGILAGWRLSRQNCLKKRMHDGSPITTIQSHCPSQSVSQSVSQAQSPN